MTQKAPERIITSVCGKQIVQDGMKRFKTDIEWMPVDHALALVAAEREACAVTCESASGVKPFSSVADVKAIITKAIRARTDDDAQAALNKLLQEARNEALREAAKAVDRAVPTNPTDDNPELEAILALITEDQSDDG